MSCSLLQCQRTCCWRFKYSGLLSTQILQFTKDRIAPCSGSDIPRSVIFTAILLTVRHLISKRVQVLFPPQKFVYTPEFTWIVLNKELHIYICIQRQSIRIRFNEFYWFLSLNRPTIFTYALFPHTLPRCKLDRLVLPDVVEWRPARIWQENRSSSQKTLLVLLNLFWTNFGKVATLIYVTQFEKQ